MRKELWISMVLVLLLGCIAVQAAEKEVLIRFSGQEWAGSISAQDPTGLVTFGNFNRTTLPDGSQGVFVTWQSCIVPPPPPPPPCPPCDPPPPPPPPVCFSQVAGIAPSTAVTALRGGDALKLDFDTATMIMVFVATGPSTWKGTLTRYSGLFSRLLETTGNSELTNVSPGGPDPGIVWTIIQKTTGRRIDASALFTGTVDSRIITSSLPNGNMYMHSGGTVTFRTTKP